MSRYAFTPAAARDLNEIWDYIAEDNPRAADEVLGEIEDAVESLANHPRMGHRRDDLADEPLRVWPVYSYLIVYRPETQPLEVVRVVSGYRDLFSLFAGD